MERLKMDKFNKKIGKRIKKIREDKGLSQQILAERIGLNRVSLSQIENGQRTINAEEISKLAKFFNISSDILLDLDRDIEVIIKEKKHIPAKNCFKERVSKP